tara:strand:+ start:102572 stop:102697 length:126 start_codon:yes stop_codon:yes gene_type:complete
MRVTLPEVEAGFRLSLNLAPERLFSVIATGSFMRVPFDALK